MRVNECLKVACWNLSAFRRQSIKIIIGMSTVILLLFCMSAYKIVFKKQILKLKEEYRTDCYCEKYMEETGWENYRKEMAVLKQRQNLFGYSESCVLADLTVLPEKKDEIVDTNISRVCLDIDGQEYTGRTGILAGIRPEKKPWKTDEILLGLWQKGAGAFPNIVVEEFEKDQPWLIGNLPEREREIMISDYMLEEFGIVREEQERLIGKEVTLYFDSKKYSAFDHYIISGIFQVKILEEREKNSSIKNMQQIYVNLDIATRKNYKIDSCVIRYYSDSYDDLLVSSEKARKTDEEIGLSLYGDIYLTMSNQLGTINDILSYVIVGFVFAVTVYLVCILYFFFQENQEFVFMLRAIGMQKSCTLKIIFGEILFFSLTSLIIGCYIGLFVLYGLKYIYDYAMLLKFEFGGRVIFFSAMIAFVYCMLVSGIFGFIYYRRIRNINDRCW